jgi:hypothetical protein
MQFKVWNQFWLSGARFSPSQLSGLKLWLDGADTNSITSSGGSVSQWSDKSGNANHAVQATAGQKPKTAEATINGRNVLSFHGNASTEWLKILNMSCTPNTLVVVHKTNEVTFTDWPGAIGARSSTSGKTADSTSASGFTGRSGGTTNICNIGSSIVSVYVDGVQLVASDYDNFSIGVTNAPMANTHLLLTTDDCGASTQNYCIGADPFDVVGVRHWNGAIAEILIYDRAITAAERTLVTKYLKSKWAIA